MKLRKKILGPVLYWVLLLAALIILQTKHIINQDDGVILEGAWNMMHGRWIYSDFFEFVTPGSFLLIAGVWKLIGISY